MTTLGDRGTIYFCQYERPHYGIGVREDLGDGPPVGHDPHPRIAGGPWAPLGGIQLWGRWHPYRDTAPCRAVSVDGTMSADGMITRELWEQMRDRYLIPPSRLAGLDA